ncbi:MAG: hypothetical protein WEB06_13855 [Actinomycetota bacterium]
MNEMQPVVELGAPYSSPNAKPTPWDAARHHLDAAGVYWFGYMRGERGSATRYRF